MNEQVLEENTKAQTRLLNAQAREIELRNESNENKK